MHSFDVKGWTEMIIPAISGLTALAGAYVPRRIYFSWPDRTMAMLAGIALFAILGIGAMMNIVAWAFYAPLSVLPTALAVLAGIALGFRLAPRVPAPWERFQG